MSYATPLTILAQIQRWDGHMMGGWGWMWIVGLLSLLLLVALVVGIVWAITHGGRPNQPARPHQRSAGDPQRALRPRRDLHRGVPGTFRRTALIP
jgi:uncharacterized membrane protein